MNNLRPFKRRWSIILAVAFFGITQGCGSNEVPVIAEPAVVETVRKFDQPKFDKIVAEYSQLNEVSRNYDNRLDEAMWGKIKFRHPDWSQDKLETQIKFLEIKHSNANMSELEDYIDSLQAQGSRISIQSETTGIYYSSELSRADYIDRYDRWKTSIPSEIWNARKRKWDLESEIRLMKPDYVFPWER